MASLALHGVRSDVISSSSKMSGQKIPGKDAGITVVTVREKVSKDSHVEENGSMEPVKAMWYTG